MSGSSFANGGSHPSFAPSRAQGAGGGPTVANVANFDWIFSYGHGDPGVDDQLPVEEGGYELWLTPTDGADIAEIGQVREWVLTDAISFLGIIARIDLAVLTPIGIGACRLVITKNGVDTAISVAIPLGTTTGTTLQVSGALAAVPGDRIGVAFETDGALDTGSTLRTEVRLKGTVAAQSNLVLAPVAGPRLWLEADVSVLRTLLDVTGWTDQSAHHTDATFVGMPPGSRHLQYVASGLNGLPGLRGTQDFTPQGLIYSGSNLYVGGSPRTVYAVVTFDGTGPFGSTGGFPLTFRRSAPMFAVGAFVHGPPDPPGHQVLYTDFDAPTTIEAAVPADYSNQSHLIRWQTNAGGTTLQTYIDGNLIAEVANVLGNELGNTGYIVGNLINDDGHAVFQGMMHEILVYDGSDSAAAVSQNEAYLLNKWGL